MTEDSFPYITKEAWEAMGVIYGTYISEQEAAILDRYAVKNMMTREKAAKAILRAATLSGKPPKNSLPEEVRDNQMVLNMMMPRPIYRFLEQLGESLGLKWFEKSRILRAFILDKEEEEP